MRVLIVTVAGMSSRFSQSLGYPCLKCLYPGAGSRLSMLRRLVGLYEFDRYILVGGYRYRELEKAVAEEFGPKRDRMILVENTKYAEWGSGYSLYLGLQKLFPMGFTEAVFAEGDLLVDRESFREVCEAPSDVITASPDPILADKAVAYYFDLHGQIHYLYDTEHRALEIGEPFTAIYNSGQIWKFSQPALLKDAAASLGQEAWKGTNLALVQSYFARSEAFRVIPFRKWFNCNTVQDYEKGIAEIQAYENDG